MGPSLPVKKVQTISQIAYKWGESLLLACIAIPILIHSISNQDSKLIYQLVFSNFGSGVGWPHLLPNFKKFFSSTLFLLKDY